MIELKKVLIEKVDIGENIIDALTKAVNTEKFMWCTRVMGLASPCVGANIFYSFYKKYSPSRRIWICLILCRGVLYIEPLPYRFIYFYMVLVGFPRFHISMRIGHLGHGFIIPHYDLGLRVFLYIHCNDPIMVYCINCK